ncbi:hypothetical protein [Burkholderia stagnalis]|uniref:hypothetical protein n=1 Tax=Burkholderia stagnalis TaxID=1503054 RepID=UPI001F3AA8C7|nr:hypothetical protein [Burkholderia stagnalis]
MELPTTEQCAALPDAQPQRVTALRDSQAVIRQNWLRDEQAPRVKSSEPARQSNFEKSKVFRWTIVACLLFAVVNVFQDDPVVTPKTAYHVNV